MPLQLRRGTNAQRQSMTEPLAAGELIYITDTGAIYVGNGTTLGGVPVINLTATDIKPLAAEAFTSGSHTGISFTYNSGTQTVDAVVNPDLSNYAGVIRASAFEGSVFPDDSSLGGAPLVDGINASINLDGTVKGNIIPDQNETYDIGSNSNRFKDLYLSGDSLHLGDAILSAVGSSIDLPAGSTVGGVPLEGGAGIVPGSNYNINIIGDDSSPIVDSANSIVNANTLLGDLYGSVFAASSSLMIDGTNGEIVGPYNNGDLNIRSNTISTQTGAIEFTSDTGIDGSKVIINFESGETSGGIFAATGVQRFDLRTIGGTFASPVDLVAGDVLGNIGFVAIQSSTSSESISGLGVIVDGNGTVSSTHVPTKLFLYTQPATVGFPNLLTFDTRGYLAVNQENASATLDVNGFAKLAVLSAAPGSPANGMIAIADGDSISGWDPLSLGAPAKQQMVVYLGGGWRQIAVEP